MLTFCQGCMKVMVQAFILSEGIYNNNNNNNNNNIYLTAIGLSPGGSGFKHVYKYLTLCY